VPVENNIERTSHIDDKEKERGRKTTINIALYTASLLLTAGILLLSQAINLSIQLRFGLVWLFIFIYYIIGQILYARLPILKSASTALIGTALAAVPIGGWWSQVVLAQQVTITTRDGKTFHGVTGSKPPHVLPVEARKVAVDIADVFIDLGATSKEEVLEWGIRPGDMITPYIEYRRLNGGPFLLGKAWDNRIGVAVAIEVLKYAASQGHASQLFIGANVQEEVGLRGAKGATHKLNPAISFALDTGTAGDTPGMTPKEADSELGKGPQVLIYDASMIPHKGLRDFVIDVAEEEGIPFQFTSIKGGGTDAGAQHQSLDGVPSIAITIPDRYLHSHTSIIHEDDFKHTVALMIALLKRLNSQTVADIVANV